MRWPARFRHRRRSYISRATVCALVGVAGGQDSGADPFASVVLRYDPAPGQFVNVVDFNDPTKALGSPRGMGTSTPDNTSVVSLGGFGGSITLAFDHTVMDDPLNPLGMDAIAFGNAFWLAGNPLDHWAECATIEISLDENGNGFADDAWFLIPGSHLPDPPGQLLVVAWDDDVTDGTYPPDFDTWLSPEMSGVWTTEAHELPVDPFGSVVVTNPSADSGVEGVFGYAEYTPTLLLGDLDADNEIDDSAVLPEDFYTVPDDPFVVGMTPRSGGGDAFDIAWAVDPETGESADLTGFDFIRITTAVVTVPGPVAEKSAEVDAVADVAPDPFGDADDDGDIDLVDVGAFQDCFGVADVPASGCSRLDREPDGFVDLDDWAAMFGRVASGK